MAYQALGQMVVDLLLNNSQFRAGLRQSQTDLQGFAGKMKSVGEGVANVGATLTKAITVPLAGIATASVKTAADFQAQMSKVQAITGSTTKEMQQMHDEAIKLGKDTAFSAKEAAEGMENLGSAGFNANEIMKAMPGMLDLAAAGDLDVAQASDIASSALRGFGLDASKTGHVADVLAKVAASTNASVGDMGETMKYIAPVAKSLGVSLEDTAAMAGEMANAGIKGSEAGTTLRSSLINLANPSKQAATLMEQIGLKAFDAHGKMLPMPELIANLQKATQGMTQEQKAQALATIFGKEAVSGMMTVIDAGPEKLQKLSDGLKNSNGEAKKMADTMKNNLNGTLDQLKGTFETIGIKIGELFLPNLKKAADSLNNLAGKFLDLSPSMQKTIVTIAGVAAAIGPLLLVVGKVISMAPMMGAAFTALTGPVGLVVVAIAGLVAAVVYLWKTNSTFRTNVTNAWKSISDSAKTIFSGLQKFWKQWGSTITALFKNVMNLIGSIFQTVVGVWSNIFKIFAGAFTGDWKKCWSGIKGFFSSLVGGLADIMSKALIALINALIVAGAGILTAVKNIVKTIIGGFSSLYGKLFDIGKHVISGLIKGIGSMVGAVVNKIKDIGGSIVSGIKEKLGIHSPSRVMAEIGVFVGAGLINGMESKKNDVTKSAVALGAGVINAFSKINKTNVNELTKNIQNKFSPAITKLNTEIKKLGISTGNNNTDLKNTQKAMEDTHQKAEKLRAEYEEIVKVKGKNSTEAKNLITQINNEGVAYDKLKQKAKDLAESIKQAQIDNINKLNDKIVSALEKRYNKEKELAQKDLDDKKSKLDEWKQAQLDAISENMSEDAKNRKQKIQEQIDAIDAQRKADELTKQDAEERNKISSLQNQIATETDAQQKLDLQKELNDTIASRNERLHNLEIENQKEALRKQQEDIDKSVENREKSIKKGTDFETNLINQTYNEKKSKLDKEQEDLDKDYEKKLSKTNLNAEAEKLIIDKSQKDIVTLLNSYGDDWEEAGTTLGERLVNGIKAKTAGIKEILQDVTNAMSKTTVNTSTGTSAVTALAGSMISGGFFSGPSTSTTNNHTSNTSNKTTNTTNKNVSVNTTANITISGDSSTNKKTKSDMENVLSRAVAKGMRMALN